MAGAFRGGAGRLAGRLDGGVADGVLGLDVVAQAGGAAVHHAAERVPAVAAGARLGRLLRRRVQGAGMGLEHAVGEGHGRVAVVRLLFQHEHGDRRVVAEQGPLERLAGEDDQALALDLGRHGQVVAGTLDHAAELLALQQPGHQLLVAALGQGRGLGRQAGGEAVRDPEPVLGTRALAGTAPARQHGRHQVGRLGAMPRVKARVMGRCVEEHDPESKENALGGVNRALGQIGGAWRRCRGETGARAQRGGRVGRQGWVVRRCLGEEIPGASRRSC